MYMYRAVLRRHSLRSFARAVAVLAGGGGGAAACCRTAALEGAPREIGRADLTGDGQAETGVYDTVGDGKGDALDTTGDGKVDTMLVDMYRDTPLRYMGYANEVGEAFRPIIPKMVAPSYGVAILYVLADARDKATKAYNLSAAASPAGTADLALVVEQGGDCLIWQLAASVFIPGFVIHQVVHFLGWALKQSPSVPALAKIWVPTLCGLAVIPFIIHPIDHGVDFVMDRTIRCVPIAALH